LVLSCDLHRPLESRVHDTDRVNRCVAGMNARHTQPVIARDLPLHARNWIHHALSALSRSSFACARLTLLSGSPPSMRAISTTRDEPSSTDTSAVVTPPFAAFETTM